MALTKTVLVAVIVVVSASSTDQFESYEDYGQRNVQGRRRCSHCPKCPDVCPNPDLQSIIDEIKKLQTGMSTAIENTKQIDPLQELIKSLLEGGKGSFSEKFFAKIRELIQYEIEQATERLEKFITKLIKKNCSPGTAETSSLEARITALAGKIDLLTSLQGGGININEVLQTILETVNQIKLSVTTVTNNNVCYDPRITNIEIICKDLLNTHLTVSKEIEIIRTEIRTVNQQVSSVSSTGYSRELSEKLNVFMETILKLKTEVSSLRLRREYRIPDDRQIGNGGVTTRLEVVDISGNVG